MKIIGTGLSGLVGSRVVDFLSDRYEFEDMSLESGVDILDKENVEKRIESTSAKWVFHLAAMTDVDGAEKERGDKTGAYWKVNVEATEHIANCCKKYGKKMLYMSTDFVFDGIKKKEYTEFDIPNPQGWYALTKYEGEKILTQLGNSALIIRIGNPYRALPDRKPDFVHIILSKLRRNEIVYSPIDRYITPTYIDDLAEAVHKFVREDASGLFHIFGKDSLTPYDAAVIISKTFGYSSSLIQKVPFREYNKGRASRPFYSIMKSAKIEKFKIFMRSFEEGLREVKRIEEKEFAK